MQTWYSNGKLLITGEYLVMEGALSLALPLNVGQSISAERNNNNHLFWQANKPDGNWFTANLRTANIKNWLLMIILVLQKNYWKFCWLQKL